MDLRRTEPPRRRAAPIAAPRLAAAVVAATLLAAAMGACGGEAARSAAPATPAPLRSVDLGGEWELLLDPDGTGRAQEWQRSNHPAWKQAVAVTVPGALETAPGATDHDGVAWYRRRLPAFPATGSARALLVFAGANDRVEVWLGEQRLGAHDGSDVAFRFDVTGRLERPGEWLVVRVVDPGATEIEGLTLASRPHAKESWYVNYGGLTGAVSLELVPTIELRAHDVALIDGAPRAMVVLHNHGDEAREVRLELSVPEDDAVGTPASPAAPSAGPVAASRHLLPPGETRLWLPLPRFEQHSWSPDDPHLHRLAVTVDDGERHRWIRRFGLRTFAVDDDRLMLNGIPIRPRGVLFQPFWPATLCRPPGAEWMQRELRAIKAAGFDLVRAHLRAMPELYAACDEIGLLVHAEPTLGWVTQIRPDTAALVDAELVQLARDVAGHPSVVMVGLLNELSGELQRRTDVLLARAHELLPQHLILDDSGSWTGSAHYWNPGADAPVPYDDLHVYRAWPWSDRDARWLRDLGADHDRLILVSEYGYGGLPSFAANVAGYRGALDTPDAREHLRQLADVEAALAAPATGPSALVSGVDELQRFGQENQARAARALASVLRGNPRVAADVYTQWRDVLWEDGAGLVDVWGGAKPALTVFTELNATREPPPDPQPDAPAHPPRLGEDDWPPDAVARLETIALDDDATETAPPGAPGDPSAPDTPDDVGDASAPGTPTGGGPPPAMPLTAETLSATPLLDPGRLAAFGEDLVARGALARADLDAWVASVPTVTVVGRRGASWSPAHIGETLSLLRWTRDGGTLLMLAPPDAGRPLDLDMFGFAGYGAVADLPFDARVVSARGHFVGTHLVFAEGSGLLDGFGPDRLFDGRFGPVRPATALDLRGVDGLRVELAAFDGYGLPRGCVVAVVPYGKGRIVISTLPLDGSAPHDPVAARMLFNLCALAARAAREGPAPGPRRPVDVPPEIATRVGELIWQHKNYFGLAERLAWQTFNGQRPVRRDLDDLHVVIENEQAALADLVADRLAEGLARLERIEEGPLRGAREVFGRAEVRLATHFRDGGGRPDLPLRLRIGELHARALAAMRDDKLQLALGLLRSAEAVVASLAPAGATGDEAGPPR